MTKCTAITRGGERCRGIAIDSSGYCHAHHPDRAEQRRRSASKGGKRGGRGRPLAELSDLKSEIRTVIAAVLTGKIQQGPGAVALQGYNTLLRAVRLELDIREQAEILERLESLEEALERRKEGRRYGA